PDLRGPPDPRGRGRQLGEQVSVLVHGEDRHPVRGRVVEPEPAVGPAHGVGERPAARDHHQRPRPAEGAQHDHEPPEGRGAVAQAAADLEDPLRPRHAAAPPARSPPRQSHATATAGAAVSSGSPRSSASSRQGSPARSAARRARNAPWPVVTAVRGAAKRAAPAAIAAAISRTCASATAPAMARISAGRSISTSAQTTRARRSAAYSAVVGRPSGVGHVYSSGARSPSRTWASPLWANHSEATGHCPPQSGTCGTTAATLVRTAPVYTSSRARSRSGSVRPRAATPPPRIGTTSAVVLPTSTRSASGTCRATKVAVATQLAAAVSSGRARAVATSTKAPEVVSTRSGSGPTPVTASRTNPTPSRLVRKASDSSAVIVTAVASAGGSAAASACRRARSSPLARQISKGRLCVSTVSPPAPASTWATLTFAPPMSQPSTRFTPGPPPGP